MDQGLGWLGPEFGCYLWWSEPDEQGATVVALNIDDGQESDFRSGDAELFPESTTASGEVTVLVDLDRLLFVDTDQDATTLFVADARDGSLIPVPAPDEVSVPDGVTISPDGSVLVASWAEPRGETTVLMAAEVDYENGAVSDWIELVRIEDRDPILGAPRIHSTVWIDGTQILSTTVQGRTNAITLEP